jgi:hypothetical protein
MLRDPDGEEVAMASIAPFGPLQIGQLVRRRIDPVSTPLVGVVGGLVFGPQNQALVRWPGPWSTFEPEDALIQVFRATIGLCQFCGERVDPENDRFVVIPDTHQAEPEKVAHTKCYRLHMEAPR